MRWIPLLVLAAALPAASLFAADAPKGRIVYPRKDGEKYILHVMNTDGTGDHALPGQTANVNVFPSWSPDGKQIVFNTADALGDDIKNNGMHITVIDADGGNLRVLTTSSKIAIFPTWSVDGKSILFTGGDEAPGAFTMDTQGNGLRQLGTPGKAGILPFWFHDGKRMGYTRFEKEHSSSELVTINPDGTDEQSVVKADKLVLPGEGGLSRDDKRLLYLALDGPSHTAELRIWDFGSKGEMFLSDVKIPPVQSPAEFPSPAWAPDGKSFLVCLKSEKGHALYRVSDDGKTQTRLTPEAADCMGGSWTDK